MGPTAGAPGGGYPAGAANSNKRPASEIERQGGQGGQAWGQHPYKAPRMAGVPAAAHVGAWRPGAGGSAGVYYAPGPPQRHEEDEDEDEEDGLHDTEGDGGRQEAAARMDPYYMRQHDAAVVGSDEAERLRRGLAHIEEALSRAATQLCKARTTIFNAFGSEKDT